MDFRIVLSGTDLGHSIVRAPFDGRITRVEQSSHGALIDLTLECDVVVRLGFPPIGPNQNFKQEPENLSSLVNDRKNRGDQIMSRTAQSAHGVMDTTARIFYTVTFAILKSNRILSIEHLRRGARFTEPPFDIVIINTRSAAEAAEDEALPADVEYTVSNRTDLGHWYPIGPAPA